MKPDIAIILYCEKYNIEKIEGEGPVNDECELSISLFNVKMMSLITPCHPALLIYLYT